MSTNDFLNQTWGVEEVSNDVLLVTWALRAPAPSRGAFLLLPHALCCNISSTILLYRAPLALGPSSFFSNLQLREGKAVFIPKLKFWVNKMWLRSSAPVSASPTEAPAWAIPDNDILGTGLMILEMIRLRNRRSGFFPWDLFLQPPFLSLVLFFFWSWQGSEGNLSLIILLYTGHHQGLDLSWGLRHHSSTNTNSTGEPFGEYFLL